MRLSALKRSGVLLVVGDAILRRELARSVDGTADLRVVAQPTTLADARRVLDERVQLALVDLRLPDGDATPLLSQLLTLAIPSLVLTGSDEPHAVHRALSAGASGYLLEADAPDRVVESLRTVRDGGAPISPRVARWVLQELQRQAPAVESPLTPREGELIQFFARGATYAEAASALGVTQNTVRQHVRRIYGKLRVGSKAEAVIAALRLTAPGPSRSP
jgi:DNA-binding NarL/FixJ family response regulator